MNNHLRQAVLTVVLGSTLAIGTTQAFQEENTGDEQASLEYFGDGSARPELPAVMNVNAATPMPGNVEVDVVVTACTPIGLPKKTPRNRRRFLPK